jgi:hypothetical protein
MELGVVCIRTVYLVVAPCDLIGYRCNLCGSKWNEEKHGSEGFPGNLICLLPLKRPRRRDVVELVGPLMRCSRHITAHFMQNSGTLGLAAGPNAWLSLQCRTQAKSFTSLPSDEAPVWKLPLGSDTTDARAAARSDAAETIKAAACWRSA